MIHAESLAERYRRTVGGCRRPLLPEGRGRGTFAPREEVRQRQAYSVLVNLRTSICMFFYLAPFSVLCAYHSYLRIWALVPFVTDASFFVLLSVGA